MRARVLLPRRGSLSLLFKSGNKKIIRCSRMLSVLKKDLGK
jgi:hypothetical protein